jgi:predicted metal-dependent hydrolase
MAELPSVRDGTQRNENTRKNSLGNYKSAALENGKEIGITVERDRRVVVRAPERASNNAISSAIERKRLWIWSKLRDPHKYPVPPVRKEFVSGETFLLFGQHYLLSLARRDDSAVELVGKRLEMAEREARNARRLLQSWYLSRARQELPARIQKIANEMGLGYSKICIRDIKFRWASYSPSGTLTFNWRAVQAPVNVIDYLIVHELAHVLQSNHSPDFWNIVAVHAPSWAKARTWLQKNGPSLEW